MAAMSVDVQERVMKLLREAAEVMEQVTDQTIYMPGWDPRATGPRPARAAYSDGCGGHSRDPYA